MLPYLIQYVYLRDQLRLCDMIMKKLTKEILILMSKQDLKACLQRCFEILSYNVCFLCISSLKITCIKYQGQNFIALYLRKHRVSRKVCSYLKPGGQELL